MVSSYYEYQPRTEGEKWTGFVLASTVPYAIYKTLPLFSIPFQNQLKKEQPYNAQYKEAMLKAHEISGLKKAGVIIQEAQYDRFVSDYSKGKNACFKPADRIVQLNTDKISASAFHEFGHAKNFLGGLLSKGLFKFRIIGYALAGLMEYFAIFSRTKPKDAPRNVTDVIEDNCGKIAFISMLPIVAEEGLASYKGIKLAKQACLDKKLVGNLKKLYAKALLTYGAHAVLGGVAVGTSRMIMDKFTRPKKVEYQPFDFFG